jgi:DNA-binding HxlR family transcriptional regulator
MIAPTWMIASPVAAIGVRMGATFNSNVQQHRQDEADRPRISTAPISLARARRPETIQTAMSMRFLLVLGMLDGAPHRFTALRDAVPGISHRMLTLTLRNLERDGLVSRKVFAEVPPRVEYSVTELGTTILPGVKALAAWALRNSAAVQRNRDQFDDAH